MLKVAQVFVESRNEVRYEQAKRYAERVLAEYDTYIVAEVEEAQIRSLEAIGFAVKERSEYRKIEIGHVEFEAEPNRESLGLASLGGDYEFYVLQFVGPVKEDWMETLEKLGVRFRGYVPHNAYVVRMWFHTIHQVTSIRGMEFVRFITRYMPEFKISSRLKGRKGMFPLAEFKSLKIASDSFPYDSRGNIEVTLHDPAYMSDAKHMIEELGGAIIESAEDYIIVAIDPSSRPIERIAAYNYVVWIQGHGPADVALDRAHQFVYGIPLVDWGTHRLEGASQIVAVTDTGLDTGVDDATMHADFRNVGAPTKIVAIHARGRPPNDASDSALPVSPPAPLWRVNKGHGTHVAGIILGNGADAAAHLGLRLRGIAPRARLVFQSVMIADGTLRLGPLYPLFRQAYNHGARIHNNSWGIKFTSGQYLQASRAVDKYVWDHRDYVIVFAAGNEGDDSNPADGIVDWNSIRPPGTAKNCITVGGSENRRPEINTRWGSFHGTPLADPPPPSRRMDTDPIRFDRVANEPEGMMAISSRGPTDPPDSRIKPEIVAPGSSILSTRSSRAALEPPPETWGTSPDTRTPPHYIFMGGTSMAAPIVSGAAALAREYLIGLKPSGQAERKMWRKQSTSVLVCGGGAACRPPEPDPHPAGLPERGNISPTAALIKAVLIHGATKIVGQYGFGQNDADPSLAALSAHAFRRIPNNNQGFGRVNLEESLFPPAPTAMEIFDGHVLTTNETREYQFLVKSATVPFKATLVWTDAPDSPTGRLVNHLNLIVHTPNAREFHGNYAWPTLFLDNVNNVQKVIQEIPVAGIYRVEVTAVGNITSMPGGRGQDYALVVSADQTATLKAVLGRVYPPNLGLLKPIPLCDNNGFYVKDAKGNQLFDKKGKKLVVTEGKGPLIRRDARTNDVRHLQEMLLALGAPNLGNTGRNHNGVDGDFRDKTAKAVIDFQANHTDWNGNPLNQDEKVGPKTSDALNREMVGRWYDEYVTPIDLTGDTPILTTVKKSRVGLKVPLSDYRDRVYYNYKVILKKPFSPIITLCNPEGNRFLFAGNGQFEIFDKLENSLQPAGNMVAADDIIPVDAVELPFTVELKVDRTFRTFYGEEGYTSGSEIAIGYESPPVV